MSYIATHVSPDWDAIMSCWLLQRHGGFVNAGVVFVNTGSPNPAVLAGATAVVDTGREFDPERRRYDHHQDAYADSATARVAADMDTPAWLEPLVAMVHHGDFGSMEYGAGHSRAVGIHAALAGAKARGLSDAELLSYGYQLLDDVAAALKARHDARVMLESVTAWRSADGLVWAIQDGGPGATHAAGELGARLVVYGYTKAVEGGPTQYGLGCWRCGGAEVATPHVGELALHAAAQAGGSVAAEIAGWFRHPVGFCALSGSDKAPRFEAPAVGVVKVARAIDAAWVRP